MQYWLMPRNCCARRRNRAVNRPRICGGVPRSAISSAKTRLVEVEHKVVDHAKYAAKATDSWVHEHPWTAIGIAAGVGVLLGLVVNRR